MNKLGLAAAITGSTLKNVGLAVINIDDGRNRLKESIDGCVPSFHKVHYQLLTEMF